MTTRRVEKKPKEMMKAVRHHEMEAYRMHFNSKTPTENESGSRGAFEKYINAGDRMLCGKDCENLIRYMIRSLCADTFLDECVK